MNIEKRDGKKKALKEAGKGQEQPVATAGWGALIYSVWLAANGYNNGWPWQHCIYAIGLNLSDRGVGL